MAHKIIPASQGRSQFLQLLQEVADTGQVIVFTVHGKGKAALIDVDLLNEFMENKEFGISAEEIVKRSHEDTISLATFKKQFHV